MVDRLMLTRWNRINNSPLFFHVSIKNTFIIAAAHIAFPIPPL